MSGFPCQTGLAAARALLRVARVAAICFPRAPRSDRITFDGDLRVEADWAGWVAGSWQQALLPALLEAGVLCRQGAWRELCELDRDLDRRLDPEAARSSIHAGSQLCRRTIPLPGDRVVSRLWSGVRTGDLPGHLATLFAARCAAFSIGERSALAAYLWIESRSGPRSADPILCATRLAAALPDRARADYAAALHATA